VIVASVLTTNLAILVLAGFIGFVVISKVPNTLHTPLMSGTNAIHGIVLLGGLLIVGLSGNGAFNKVILVIAIMFGTINIVGGFLVTDRMLEMFKSKPKPAAAPDPPPAAKATPPAAQATPPAAQPTPPAAQPTPPAAHDEAPGEQQRGEQ
jgi:NAD(P) transhydrogenase subunit alpha